MIFFVIFIEGEKEIDIKDAVYTNVLFLLLEKVINQANENEIDISKEIYERITRYWNSIYEVEDISSNIAELGMESEMNIGIKSIVLNLLSKVKGVLKTSEETLNR